MAIICPTVLAATTDDFDKQMERVGHLGNRLQIDLTDGRFAPTDTIKPQDMWWPAGVKADIHLMYQAPETVLADVLAHLPNLVIIHAEADGDFHAIVRTCNQQGVKVGVALLAPTKPESIFGALSFIDHVLIFSGDLGRYGGEADLHLLKKAETLKAKKPDIEIGWDGGVNDQNVKKLAEGGVDVLNVGGFIQKASDPSAAFKKLSDHF